MLLVGKQLAKAVDRDLLRLGRVQRRAPGARICRQQRSIRVRPSVPVRLAVQRFEGRIQLVALQPIRAPFREAAHPFLEAAIGVGALPGVAHDAGRDLVRIHVRRARERPLWTGGDGIGQRFPRNEPLFHELREAEGADVPAEEGRVVWRRILGIGLALGAELQPMKTEIRRELEERAPSPRQGRATSDVVARVAGQREVVHRKQQAPDPQRLQRVADDLAQPVTPCPAPARWCRAAAA